ncbi:hypothetical protein CapIbe_023532 [Capra ibex]
MPTPTESPDPREEGCLSGLGPAGNAMADDAVAFLTLQRPVSHGGAGPRHREGPGWDTRRMQLQLGRGPS